MIGVVLTSTAYILTFFGIAFSRDRTQQAHAVSICCLKPFLIS
jgi:hypothetical protein